MIKKIFIISAVLLILVVVFGGIYNFAFKEKSAEKTTTSEKAEQAKNQKSQPVAATGKIYPITDEAVISPAISKDGERLIYYARSSGKVYEISFRGTEKKTVSSIELPGLAKVIWSSNKNKVISIFNKSGSVEKYFYSYETKSGKRLPDAMESITWTNLGDKILYKFSDARTKKQTIGLSDPDGSNWSNLAEAPWKNISIAPVPQTSLVSFWNSPNGFEETTFQKIGISGGEAKKIFTGKFGADYLWSPNGEKALVSSSETKGSSKVTLAAINAHGGEYQNLNIPTIASKCVWSNNNKTVYCALPGSIPDGSVMPNDYLDKKFTTRDSFWKIDVATGKQKRLVELGEIKETFDAANFFLSPSESMLFFVNRIDGKLYGIEI